MAEVPNHPIEYKQGILWMNDYLLVHKDNRKWMAIYSGKIG